MAPHRSGERTVAPPARSVVSKSKVGSALLEGASAPLCITEIIVKSETTRLTLRDAVRSGTNSIKLHPARGRQRAVRARDSSEELAARASTFAHACAAVAPPIRTPPRSRLLPQHRRLRF